MDFDNTKCVIVIDKELPIGLIANTSAILGCSLGTYVSGIVGGDVLDNDNFIHKGVIQTPLPILSLNRVEIKKLHDNLAQNYADKITILDFNDVAQKCKDYEDYIQQLSNKSSDDLTYLGICIYGDKKIINKTTGCLPTLK